MYIYVQKTFTWKDMLKDNVNYIYKFHLTT